MVIVKFSNGTRREYRDTDTLSVRNFPISDVPKTGYERTRDYPAEWSKFTPIRVTALLQGTTVSFGNELVQIDSVEIVK